MAGEVQDNVWPLPKFQFEVTIDDWANKMAFQEVSGLDTEVDIVEYRHSNSPVHSSIKMPGLKKVSDITMKKGTFVKDNQFFDWFNEIKMNTIKRRLVTIALLDESNAPVITWKLTNAFPMKISGTDLNSTSSEAAVEEIVFAHEGLEVEAA